MTTPAILSSVPNVNPYIQYVAAGGQTVFPYAFPITLDADLIVIVNGVTQPTDFGYTLSGVGQSNGGNLTFTLGRTSGDIITLYRNIAVQRVTQISQNAGFSSTTFNAEYNQIYLLLQQLQESIAFSLQIPNTNSPAPTTSLLPANYANKYLAFDANGNPTPAALTSSGSLTQSIIATLLNPQSTAENHSASAIINPQYNGLEVINVLRYGIVPNNAGAAAANGAIWKALLSPLVAGPTGRLVFPNTTGSDTYYIGSFAQIRDYIDIDLCGCTLNLTKTYASSDNSQAWLGFIRNVSIRNGSITVNYDGTGGAGTNAGMIMLLGSRQGYAFGTYVGGVYDQTTLTDAGLAPMGNIVLENLRLTTNNPLAAVSSMVLMFGGLRNVRVENVVCTGNGVGVAGAETGFYYEFGYSSQNGFPATPAKWSSSHMHNVVFRNVTGKNLYTGAGGSGDAGVVTLVDAYNCLVENIHGEACGSTFSYRIGESHMFRPWSADLTGVKRSITVRNITSQGNINTNAIQLLGAAAANGYLSDANMIAAGLPVLTPIQKVDLMRFSLNGFSVDGQVAINGPIDLRNGTATGGTNPIWLQAECQRFHILNVEALNGAGVGIRANDASTIFARNRIGTIRNSKVCGNVGAGVSLANTASVLVEECQLGFNALYDAGNEVTQTDGVSVDGTGTNAGGVYCKGNFVTVSGAGVGYRLSSGTTTICCGFEQARGVITSSGTWDVDGVAQTNAATIADKTSFINNFNGAAGVTNKYLGRRCYDTSNTRLMIAQGTGATSNWVRADGGATVTPV